MNTSISPLRRVVLFLFGLVLLGGSGFGLYVVGLVPYFKGMDRANWHETPCHVTESSTYMSYDDKGKAHSNLTLEYMYTVDGVSHRASKYGFFGSDSDLVSNREIVARYPRGKDAVCYVNPADPGEAVLDLYPFPGAWSIWICLFFVILGAVLLMISIFQKSSFLQKKAWLAKRPEMIRMEQPGRLFYQMAGIVLWAVVLVPIVLWHLQNGWKVESFSGLWETWPLWILVGVAVEVLALVIFVWSWLYWARFGRPVFELSGGAGFVGGTLEGTLRLGKAMNLTGPTRQTLICQKTTQAGKHRVVTTEWMKVKERSALASEGLTHAVDSIPVAFAIPDDAMETMSKWRLRLTQFSWGFTAIIPLESKNYKVSFTVPVYKADVVPQERLVRKAEIEAQEAKETEAYVPSSDSRAILRTSPTGNPEFFAPSASTMMGKLTLFVLFAVLAAGAYWAAQMPRFSLNSDGFGLVVFLGIFAMVFFFSFLGSFSGATSVEMADHELVGTRYVLGIPFRKRRPFPQIQKIQSIVMPMNAKRHNVVATLLNGKKWPLILGLKDSKEADWLALQLQKNMESKRHS